MNACGACGHDFASLALFDAHRVGRHALDWPEHPDGRRCLDAQEMRARGWRLRRGRWQDPVAAERVRARFATTEVASPA